MFPNALGAGTLSTFGGGASHAAVNEVGRTGQNLLDAMSSKFVASVPAGLPMGQQSEMLQNATVKKVI